MSLITLIPLLLACALVWAGIFYRWRIGVIALVVFTPFTGLVVSAFAPSPVGNLVRDFAIIIPLYLAFMLTRRPGDRLSLPLGFAAIVGVLTILIAANAAVGATAGTLVALLGAKIWLFYIPLVAVTAAFIRDKTDLLALLRLVVVMGWIPCAVGLLMWIGAVNLGHKESVEVLYGDFARNATQNFQTFQIGQSKIYRIPGTFQFAAQYAMFCVFMVFPILMQLSLEHSRKWRLFGYASLALVIAAALTSGSRGMFLHLPFIFVVLGLLRFGFARGGNGLIVFAFVVFGAVLMSQFDESAMFDHVAELTAANGQKIALGGLQFAIDDGGVWGKGIGSGTVAARHLINVHEAYRTGVFMAIENYYAKAWIEMGMLGFAAIVALFVYLLVLALRSAATIRDSQLRDVGIVAAGLVIFMVYVSTRGWPLD